jgi:hypothetical protein
MRTGHANAECGRVPRTLPSPMLGMNAKALFSSRALGLSALFATSLLAGCNAFDASRLGPGQRVGAQATPEDIGTPDAAMPTEDEPTHDAQINHDARMQGGSSGSIETDGDDDEGQPEDAGTHAGDASEPCGACGCDAPSTDSDNDEYPDCVDACPDDPAKSQPGACGCHHPERDEGSVVSCSGLIEALAHRYRFEGQGSAITDFAGNASGTLVGGELSSESSVLELGGGTEGPYVDLPNGTLSALTNATFEVWVSWTGVGEWTRIFDFGNSTAAAEDMPDYGATYLFLSPRVDVEGVKTMRAAFTHDGDPALVIVDGDPLPTTGVHHIAVVVDDSSDQLRLYMDGVLQSTAVMTESLSSVRDKNNWIGRSQFSGDPELSGALHELRIYDQALSEDQIALSIASGPDPDFLEPAAD